MAAIQISGDPNTKNITVDPTVGNYHQGDLVQWAAANGTSLTLDFSKNNSSPFDVVQIVGAAGGGSVTAERRILANAALGRYHYSLTVTINGATFTIPGCPELVIG